MRIQKLILMVQCLFLGISLLACGNEEIFSSTTELQTQVLLTDVTEADTSETVPLETKPNHITIETDEQITTPPVTETTSPPETEPQSPPCYYVDGYEYRINITSYRSYIDPANVEDYLILANRLHPLPEGYVPSDLIRFDSSHSLMKAAYYAWTAMSKEMKVLGVLDASVQSAYRSEVLQKNLYQKYLDNERRLHPTYTEAQLAALVDKYSARPGTSDHQTGLAIDFYPISSRFEHYRAYEYLIENAHKFGFILRFPKGKTDVTGYMFESWHWRFVGRTVATEIYKRNLTLEEYYHTLPTTDLFQVPKEYQHLIPKTESKE